MTRRTERQRRSENLIKAFLQYCKARATHLSQRARRQQRFLRRTGQPEGADNGLESILDELPDVSTLDVDVTMIDLARNSLDSVHSAAASASTNDTSESSGDITSGDNDSSSFTSLASSFSSLFSDSEVNNMPELLPAGYPDSDEEDVGLDPEDDSSSSAGDSSNSEGGYDEGGYGSGIDGDVEDWEEDECEIGGFEATPTETTTTRLSRAVREELVDIYDRRYDKPRQPFPRPPGTMPHVLNVLKTERPDHFRQELRVSPYTFDCLVSAIINDPIFSNRSSNEQMPVEDQVAITLYRFGHFGNAAGLDKVAKWSGYSKGTVGLATRRVMTAILRKEFMDKAVSLPTAEEKEAAKEWVESHSCKGWRGGWCMVDGTLVPLFDRPFWYGESYFDRKCNYSLNIQIVSLPNLRIIDYGYGFTGSTHDSTAWEETRIFLEHVEIFDEGEFIWGDSAYPIELWLVAPFKKPDSDLPDNEIFNNHVSMIRIRSEHAIGFLKGRFQSLKGLRILIKDEASHKFATYWVVAAIGIHSFAMKCEMDERGVEDSDDPFIAEGASVSSDSDQEQVAPFPTRSRGPRSLARAKAYREHLKALLFRAREKRARRQEQGLCGEGSSGSE